MPPARLATSAKPAFCRSTTACAERAPERHTATTGVSRASSPARDGNSASGMRRDPRMWPSGPSNSSRSRTSTTCTWSQMLLEDAGGISQMPAKVNVSGAHCGSAGGALPRLGLAALQVRRHRDVHELGMRQPEVLHVADEVALADVAAEARIEAALLGDARHREAAVVVRGIEQARRRQRQDLALHRAVHRARVALLEVGAAAAADQQAVAGERHALVVEHVGDAAVRVPGRRAHLERSARRTRRGRRAST